MEGPRFPVQHPQTDGGKTERKSLCVDKQEKSVFYQNERGAVETFETSELTLSRSNQDAGTLMHHIRTKMSCSKVLFCMFHG